jgi:transposase-like protein
MTNAYPRIEFGTLNRRIPVEGRLKQLAYIPYFRTHDEARVWLEEMRWRRGRICPHCGAEKSYCIKAKPGFYRCGNPACRKDFSVTTRTLMERSHIPLHKWLIAFYFMASGFTVRVEDLRSALGLTYRSAWMLWHRIYDLMLEANWPGILPRKDVCTTQDTDPPQEPVEPGNNVRVARAVYIVPERLKPSRRVRS